MIIDMRPLEKLPKSIQANDRRFFFRLETVIVKHAGQHHYEWRCGYARGDRWRIRMAGKTPSEAAGNLLEELERRAAAIQAKGEKTTEQE
jgi:hypothetical protein